MSMNDGLTYLLPTPLAKWSVALTCTLLLPAFQSPVFLKPLLWPTATDKELLLLQLLATMVVLLVGSLVTLALVIRAYHALSVKHEKEIGNLVKSHQIIDSAKNKRYFTTNP